MKFASSDNLFGLSPYIVDLNNSAYYSTIQSAINQAVADGHGMASPTMIFVRCATYVEDIVLQPGIFVTGICNREPFAPRVIISGSVSVNAVGANLYYIENLAINSPIGNTLILSGTSPIRFFARNLQISTTAANAWGIDLNCASGTFGLTIMEDCDVNGDDYAVNVVNHNAFACFRNTYNSNNLAAVNVSNTSRFTSLQSTLNNGNASLILNDTATTEVDYSTFTGPVFCNDTSNAVINYTSIFSGAIEGITIAVGASCQAIANIVNSSAASGFWVTGTGTFVTGGNNTLSGTNTLIDPALALSGFPAG